MDDKRYVVKFEAYVYAPNDYMARKRAHKVNDQINAMNNVQDSALALDVPRKDFCWRNDLRAVPFGVWRPTLHSFAWRRVISIKTVSWTARSGFH